MSRDKIIAVFGTPNEISNEGGQEQDVYEFNPDGSKIRKAENAYARNIAAGVFTGGIATVVTRREFITLSSSSPSTTSPPQSPMKTVQSVQKESRSERQP